LVKTSHPHLPSCVPSCCWVLLGEATLRRDVQHRNDAAQVSGSHTLGAGCVLCHCLPKGNFNAEHVPACIFCSEHELCQSTAHTNPPLNTSLLFLAKRNSKAIYLVGLFLSVLRRGQRTDTAMPHKDLLGLQTSNSLRERNARGRALVCLIAQ
jgi:hypothetical protein